MIGFEYVRSNQRIYDAHPHPANKQANGKYIFSLSPETAGSAAIDLRFCPSNDEDIVLEPMKIAVLETNLKLSQLTKYCSLDHTISYLLVMSRSGMAAKHGVVVLNSPGLVDIDYTGEIKVILINLGAKPYVVHNTHRIAQLLYCESPKVFANAPHPTTATRVGGFGSTGDF